MKSAIIIILFVLKGNQLNSQILSGQNQDSCSLCFSQQFSHFWKNDSAAHNGFRLLSYGLLLNCKFVKVTDQCLLKVLGKPDRISIDNMNSKYYIYYYLNEFTLPYENGENLQRDLLYITFCFENGSKYVTYAVTGHYD